MIYNVEYYGKTYTFHLGDIVIFGSINEVKKEGVVVGKPEIKFSNDKSCVKAKFKDGVFTCHCTRLFVKKRQELLPLYKTLLEIEV